MARCDRDSVSVRVPALVCPVRQRLVRPPLVRPSSRQQHWLRCGYAVHCALRLQCWLNVSTAVTTPSIHGARFRCRQHR